MKMIYLSEQVIQNEDDCKVIQHCLLLEDEDLIIEVTHSDPDHGPDYESWNESYTEIVEYDGDCDLDEVLERWFDMDYDLADDFKHLD